MSDYKWIHRRGTLGEVAVDLHRCQRFVVSDPRIHDWAEELTVYYLLAEDEEEIWVRHWERQEYDTDPENPGSEWVESFEQVDPREVAHDMLWRYDGKLPPELEDHRALVSDPRAWSRWRDSLDEGGEPDQAPVVTRPKWDGGNHTLTVGGIVWQALSRDAVNQSAILDKLEREGWPASVRNPLGTREQLRDAVK